MLIDASKEVKFFSNLKITACLYLWARLQKHMRKDILFIDANFHTLTYVITTEGRYIIFEKRSQMVSKLRTVERM